MRSFPPALAGFGLEQPIDALEPALALLGKSIAQVDHLVHGREREP